MDSFSYCHSEGSFRLIERKYNRFLRNSDIFRKFKEWWFKFRGLEVVEKTKTSIYERLKEAQKIADEHIAQRKRKPKKKEHGLER